MTYLVLNCVVLVVVLAVLVVKKYLVKWSSALTWTLIVLLATTALFDSLIIWAKIVDYDKNLITGLFIGLAPVEDFFYTLLAVILVPSIWHASKKVDHE